MELCGNYIFVKYNRVIFYIITGAIMKKKIMGFMLTASLTMTGTSAYAVTADQKKSKSYMVNHFQKMFHNTDYIKSELIVKLSNNLQAEEKNTFLKLFDIAEIKSIGKGYYVISFSKGMNITNLADKLSQHRLIESVEPNYLIKKEFTPKDPFFKKQWYLSKINTPLAWDKTKGSNDIVVAVIDGGVHTSHPELKGKLYKPFDAVDGDTTFFPDDHGTHVAGIIAASQNATGVSGIAPNVKIMPVNVFYGDSTSSEELTKGIYYAADNGADVINLSLGSYYYSSVIEQAIKYAHSKGVIVVAAAGNDHINKKTYPAAYSGVLGISATNNVDKAAYFSNYGSYVDFAAPGEDIYSTIAYGRYGFMSGTSMAAPVVSGTVALVLSKNPFLSNTEVYDLIKKSSIDLFKAGWDEYSGFGRIDASLAILNTPEALSNLNLSHSQYLMNGNNKVSAVFKAYAGTLVTAYVKDNNGKIVRTISKNQKANGKAMTVFWDGKSDKGLFLPTGTYKLGVTAIRGNSKRSKEIKFSVTNTVKPAVSLEKESIYYSPKVLKNLSLKIKLNKKLKVSARVYNKNGNLVKKIWDKKNLYGGDTFFTWSGRGSNGKIVADGDYKLKIDSIDDLNQKGPSKYVNVKIDSKAPSLKNIAVSPGVFKIGKTSVAKGQVSANEPLLYNMYIVNSSNQIVKILAENESLKKGLHSITWDGKYDNKNYVKPGKYKFVFVATDLAGNKTLVSSMFTIQK
jgi:subtilisin family serine protease/flagellar hook assembly protein FlgD